ncbi:UDP-N-acetylmuramate:L-alanyl-gamma-D-glutamyl-meso-diaminopimelate ligase, partial [Alcanivorax sp. HI0083]
ETPFFVVEADEYDTAFFDKRSKFVHYRPRTVILNNLEFDHADIFADLAAIQTQFHHLIRTVPSTGRLILPHGETALEETLDQGCWSEVERFGEDQALGYRLDQDDGSVFTVLENGEPVAQVRWDQTGRHSVNNGMAALLAARHVGVTLADGAAALSEFVGVKRRMELRGEVSGVRVYDDFAHHPTAIATTLDGLRRKVGDGKILAIIEPRSNTMRLGNHKAALAGSTVCADEVIWYQPPGLDWSLDSVLSEAPVPASVSESLDEIVAKVVSHKGEPLNVVVMSNGGFGGIHQKLLDALAE